MEVVDAVTHVAVALAVCIADVLVIRFVGVMMRGSGVGRGVRELVPESSGSPEGVKFGGVRWLICTSGVEG